MADRGREERGGGGGGEFEAACVRPPGQGQCGQAFTVVLNPSILNTNGS